jgi:sortase A
MADDYPLPEEGAKSKNDSGNKAAADLIRKKIEQAYAHEPDLDTEAEASQEVSAARRSRHQKFIHELTTSGKPIEEVQTAWHDYYAGLTDTEKHEVWQEFYAAHNADKLRAAAQVTSHPVKLKPVRRKRTKITKKAPKKRQGPLHSLAFGLAAGCIAMVIVLFSFFNERFIAPFIQPSRSLSNVPLIANTAIGKDPEIIIPKINVQIPVVYGVTTIDEPTVQKALEGGVVHYADTAEPGENGNVVVVGHSSNNIFNKGKYKFAFVLLSRLEPGDTFYLQKDGKRYAYEIYQKKIVKPNDVSVLGPTEKTATASLITCDPPGTSVNRLVVTGEQISPNPSKNKPSSTSSDLARQTKVLPSNAQSLWSRFWSVLSR